MTTITPSNSHENVVAHLTTICWKSIFGGLLVSLLIFILELCAGLAFGGIGLSGGTSGDSALRFTGSWVTISAIVATFLGAFLAVRATRKVDVHSGLTNALIVVSIFVILFLTASGSIVTGIANVAGGSLQALAGSAKDGAVSLGQNSYLQGKAYDALGELKLKHDPESVGKNIAARLMNKDVEGAKSYLASEAGLSPQEANQKIDEVESKVNEAAVKVRETTAQAMKDTGFSLFTFILLSIIAGLLGGFAAARRNIHHTGRAQL